MLLIDVNGAPPLPSPLYILKELAIKRGDFWGGFSASQLRTSPVDINGINEIALEVLMVINSINRLMKLTILMREICLR